MSKIKTEIALKDLPLLYQQFHEAIKIGDPRLENMQCIFYYQDDSITYVYPIFDFLDIPKSQLNKIIKFFLIQPS